MLFVRFQLFYEFFDYLNAFHMRDIRIQAFHNYRYQQSIRWQFSFWHVCNKCIKSLGYDGKLWTMGFKKSSTKMLALLVMLSIPDIMGQPGGSVGFLWILGSAQNIGVTGQVTLRNSQVAQSMRPPDLAALISCRKSHLKEEISCKDIRLYQVLFRRILMHMSLYLSLSIMTTFPPLSEGLMTIFFSPYSFPIAIFWF